jgi:hypothetical protein
MTKCLCNETMANTRNYKFTATCDQIAWLKDDIYKAIKAGIRIKEGSLGGKVFAATINGLVEGTLLEMLEILNIEPDYANINTKVK